MRVGTGPTRSMIDINGTLYPCDQDPGQQVQVTAGSRVLGSGTTLPLDATQPCEWCGREYAPAGDHPYAGEVAGQCGPCLASGYLQNEHADNDHSGDVAGSECPDCDTGLVELAVA